MGRSVCSARAGFSLWLTLSRYSDLQKLRDANATDASKLFLEQMIQHHQGAIDMARTEVSGGQNQEVVTLAKAVVADQQTEIDHMKQMLAGMK